jgi:hypothetical protein
LKKLLFTLTIVSILFVIQITNSSCSKTNTVTNTVTDTVVKTVHTTDTVTKFIPYSNTVANLFLSKQWIVDSLYQNYTASTPGNLVYARGGSGNTQNLDNFIVIMWPDGTQYFSNGSSFVNYSFTFRTADSLNLLINNTSADYARIVKLTTNYMVIYDSTNSALSYYVYKP